MELFKTAEATTRPAKSTSTAEELCGNINITHKQIKPNNFTSVFLARLAENAHEQHNAEWLPGHLAGTRSKAQPS